MRAVVLELSLFDLDRDTDLISQLEGENKEKYHQNRADELDIRHYMIKNDIAPGEDMLIDKQLSVIEKENKALLGSQNTFKDMQDLPREVADEEAYYLQNYASTVGIKTKPNKTRIAPYTTTTLGVPIIGRMIHGQDSVPKGHGVQVAFGGGGGAYKHAFDLDINAPQSAEIRIAKQ